MYPPVRGPGCQAAYVNVGYGSYHSQGSGQRVSGSLDSLDSLDDRCAMLVIMASFVILSAPELISHWVAQVTNSPQATLLQGGTPGFSANYSWPGNASCVNAGASLDV